MENPHVSKQWPGKLFPKIDVFRDGAYLFSSNAYESLKAAKHGAAFTLGLPEYTSQITAHYSE